MEDQTFRSRLTLLVQKSRKAVRLYNNVGSISELGGSELTGVQVLEWKNVNSELLRRLSLVVEITNHRFQQRRDERVLAELGLRDLDDDAWFGQVPTSQSRGAAGQGSEEPGRGLRRVEGERLLLGTSQLRDKSILNEGVEEPEPRIAKVIPIQKRS